MASGLGAGAILWQVLAKPDAAIDQYLVGETTLMDFANKNVLATVGVELTMYYGQALSIATTNFFMPWLIAKLNDYRWTPLRSN